jgi:uracil-DNA glycosylase
MNGRVLAQYLEFLKLSGIRNLYYQEQIPEKNETKTLEYLKEYYSNCKRCELSKARTHFVYGNGNEKATLMLIGEGPGEEEDKTGNVFVGKAGQLLTKMMKAINLEREEIYITNIVKCRPPGNRNPNSKEVAACLPYLSEQIELVQPKLLLLLGRVAAVSLFHIEQTLGKYRNKPLYFQGIKTYITYHPSALLRNPKWKMPAWEDLQKLKADYDFIKNKD